MKNQAKTTQLRALCLAAALIVAGCASRVPAPVADRGSPPLATSEAATASQDLYLVKKGDTVRSIARAHSIDFRDLIAWNAIENPNSIVPGMSLRVKPGGASGAPGYASGYPPGTESAVPRPIVGAPMVESRPLDNSPGSSSGASASSPAPGGGNTATLKREPRGGKEAYSDAALAQAQGQPRPTADPSPSPSPALLAAAAVKPETKPEPTPVAAPAAVAPTDDMAWIWPNNGKIIGTFSEGASKGVDIAGKAGDPVLAAGEGKVVYSGTGLRGYGKLVIVKHNSTYLSAYAHNQNVLVKEGQSVSKGQKIAEMGNTDADQVKLHFEVRRQGKPVDPLKYLPPR
jgi:lipoprotein NlpD